MAVSPPFDILTALPGLAMNKLQPVLNKQIDRLTALVNDTVADAIKLPENISCDDPRIDRIKDKLEDIKNLVDKIAEILRVLLVIIPAIRIGVQIGSSIKLALLIIPLPTPPAANEAVQVQNDFIANAIKALDQAIIIILIANSSIAAASALLAQAIQIISGICLDEEFDVDLDTKNALDLNAIKDLNLDPDQIVNSDILNQYGANLESDFYQKVNVSEQDINDRLKLIDDLVEQQRSIVGNLLEAPSDVIINEDPNASGIPSSNIGKQGDYYLDIPQNKIYGPKISDTEWNSGINY